MSSGFIFRKVETYCSSGMGEYLLDLCISEFNKINEHEKFPHILEYFTDLRSWYFGSYIIIDEDDFSTSADYLFLSKLLHKVIEFAKSDKSTLTDIGKKRLEENFPDLIPELEKFARHIT